jgi:hypothetical protein
MKVACKRHPTDLTTAIKNIRTTKNTDKSISAPAGRVQQAAGRRRIREGSARTDLTRRGLGGIP